MIESAGRVTGLVLAGGLAERMGACKALLPLNGASALETIVSRMREAGVAEIVVVTGGHEEAITAEANRLGCRPVHNPAYRDGMFGSILTGVRALPPAAEAFFLLPVDTPLIKTATYRTLYDVFFGAHCNPDVVYPTFRGERGHPPLIGRALFGRILEWHGARGLRGFFEESPHRWLDVPTGDRATQLDMDTPEDYAALAEYAVREWYPDGEECAELIGIKGTPSCVAGHMRAVARVAWLLSDELEKNEIFLNRRLLLAACLLHDIAKGQPNHDEEGARWLHSRGYTEIADIVGAHSDLPRRDALKEAEVLYLADKVTEGEAVVPLAARMQKMKKRFPPGTEARETAHRRLSHAIELQRAVERATGKPLEKILEFAGLRPICANLRLN